MSAGGKNYDGTPTNAVTSTLRGLTGTYDPTKQTEFSLFLDAGTHVASGTQARISYDFNGDEVFDRTETFRYFAEDNRVGWESYTQARGLRSSTGTFADFRSGSVKTDVWNAIGTSAVSLRTGATIADGQQSLVRVPFKDLKVTTATPPPVAPPSVAVSPSVVPLGTTPAGTAGTSHTFSVSGSQLTAGLSITAPAHVQLSLNGASWTSALTLSPNATGTVASTAIQARLAASASVGSFQGAIVVTSTGASPKQVVVSGTVSSVPSTPLGNTLYFLASGALSGTPDTGAQATTIASAGGKNFDGTPTNAITSTIRGLTGTYDPTKTTEFSLFLDAGTQVANGTQIRISYDFNGDGVFDRVETYRYFATDNRVGWEAYTQAKGLHSSTGSFADFRSGSVKTEIWNAIGRSAVTLRTGATATGGQQSLLRLPFKNLTAT